ncbi:flagellar assembly protein A [Massilia sp.]|uniref:flagellar assembly protein A n=1 Tax=Massilia sp. TaxID=1882437 RepID=UPI0028A2D952|nr:flagellar assembly protein A [Massilia sp.]
MSDPAAVLTPANPPGTPATRFAATGPAHCIDQRPDGVYADPAVLGTTLLAAVDGILRAGRYFTGLDYPVLIKALFDSGPALPVGPDGVARVRLADDIVPFNPQRRALYRSVRIMGGAAEYCFEPVHLTGADGEPEVAARLDIDEFVADMWLKGIRFGIDIAAVRAAIALGNAGRIVVARRLEPVAGIDASVIEVSEDIHRSNAPRQLANGKLDLMRFQNRFPQVKAGTRLLQKLPPRAGTPGFEISGIRIAPAAPRDLDFATYAGAGTSVEKQGGDDYLVALRTGFLNVDGKTRRISVDDRIVSRDGVSVRTTGNLQLSGDFEEFGEVQEKRVIEGTSITVHADVYGEIVSRGGAVRLRANLVGGRAYNRQGDIVVDGVASSATIQALAGTVTLQRAENCVVAATRVCIEQAVNCDIVADEVAIGSAEGCALAACRVRIDSAAPWRDSEMLVHALLAECGRIDEVVKQVRTRLAQIEDGIERNKAELARLCAEPEVRKYLGIAGKVRSGETRLNPSQAQQFQRMGQAAGPALAKIGEVGAARKSLDAELAEGQALLARFEAQRAERAGLTRVDIGQLAGETQVRTLAFDPDAPPLHHMAPREIHTRLRGAEGARLYTGASGAYRWENEGGAKAQ